MRISKLAAGVFSLAAALSARPLETSVSKERLAATLDPLIPKLMKDGDVPGLSLAVVKNGRVAWSRAYGVRSSTAETPVPINDDTIFEAASLSKPVFAYAVLKLVDAGVIDLDTPVIRYLPGDYADDPRVRFITPRHVLSHATGFPNWRSSRTLVMHFAPGERFIYSGEGFVYLQKAVEQVTGQSFHALMKRLVFAPLGMTSSSFTWEDRFEGLKSTGHDAIGSPRPVNRPALAESAATLHTTTSDYARFLIASLDGAGLKKTTYAEMIRPQIHVDEGCSNCITSKPTGRLSKEIAWGLGWGLQETTDGLSIWHWGDNGAGFQCYVVGYPRERLGLVVFTNSLDGHGIIPDIVAAAIGGQQPAFAWIKYERYDSPTRAVFKDILARGAPAIDVEGLTEEQVNRIGYWLMAHKRLPDAIAVFETNVRNFPTSWNAYDSLGEAYAEDGQREKATVSYEKSIALNPENTNGVEALKRLKASS
jgi:CubicO group peptidase (beta-lactamase class C family)